MEMLVGLVVWYYESGLEKCQHCCFGLSESQLVSEGESFESDLIVYSEETLGVCCVWLKNS